MVNVDRFAQVLARKNNSGKSYYGVVMFSETPDNRGKHCKFSMDYESSDKSKAFNYAKELAECIEGRIISLNWRTKMPKTKVDRYVKVEKHYKDSKPYYTVNLFSKNPDEQPLGTYKQFAFRYETGDKMTADNYAYKVSKCLEIPISQ